MVLSTVKALNGHSPQPSFLLLSQRVDPKWLQVYLTIATGNHMLRILFTIYGIAFNMDNYYLASILMVCHTGLASITAGTYTHTHTHTHTHSVGIRDLCIMRYLY